MEGTRTRFPLCGEREFECTDGTVYQLMHHGWSKGEEQFRNRVWLSVNVDAGSGLKRDEAAAWVKRSCNAFDPMLLALVMVVDTIAFKCLEPQIQQLVKEALNAAGAA